MAEPDYTYRCSLVRVIDGDSLVLDIDLGFRMVACMPIRLLGVNSPERGRPQWDEARDFTERWMTNRTGLTVSTQKAPEKYGRWLGTVQATGSDTTLNDALLLAGLAVPYG